jgi:glycerophosphoryl diester phosphodiesterase
MVRSLAGNFIGGEMPMLFWLVDRLVSQYWVLFLCGTVLTACLAAPHVHKPDSSADLPADLLADLCAETTLPLILGHRGLAWNSADNPYPENTVLSALAALEAGADGAEIDLTKTADDVVVLAHENALHFESQEGLPKTSCDGRITKSTWEEIEDCLAYSYMEDGFEEPLSRLEDLLSAAPDTLFVLDVKNDQIDLEPWLTVWEIYQRAVAAQVEENIVLMLYEPETIRFALALGMRSCLKIHFREERSDEMIAEEVLASGAWGLCAYSKLLTPTLLEEHHARGLEVSTYYLGSNISDETYDAKLADWAEWGVHSVITDRVDRGAQLMSAESCNQ